LGWSVAYLSRVSVTVAQYLLVSKSGGETGPKYGPTLQRLTGHRTFPAAHQLRRPFSQKAAEPEAEAAAGFGLAFALTRFPCLYSSRFGHCPFSFSLLKSLHHLHHATAKHLSPSVRPHLRCSKRLPSPKPHRLALRAGTRG
jgi:hypothetical protein